MAPYTIASPYTSVADPTEPTTRYFSPDSSEPSRRVSDAHRMYSGIDSSSIPRNSVTRFWAETNIAIPSTLNRSSA